MGHVSLDGRGCYEQVLTRPPALFLVSSPHTPSFPALWCHLLHTMQHRALATHGCPTLNVQPLCKVPLLMKNKRRESSQQAGTGWLLTQLLTSHVFLSYKVKGYRQRNENRFDQMSVAVKRMAPLGIVSSSELYGEGSP